MKAQDPFAEIIRRESARAGTTASTASSGLMRLPMLAGPKRRQIPDVARSFGLIDPGLLEIFRRLVGGRVKWPLLLSAPAGTGKTRAALCLCDIAETAAYATTDGLCKGILANTVNWEWIARSHLAVLDELAMRTDAKDLDYVAVKQFADRRENKPAVYITNVAPRDLIAVYDDRIYSRVACGTWYELNGDDRRMV